MPTATTYERWDCSTSTSRPGHCTPIRPQTAPTSTNSVTYSLQAYDVGKYVFSEVTITNANGQINATSTPDRSDRLMILAICGVDHLATWSSCGDGQTARGGQRRAGVAKDSGDVHLRETDADGDLVLT